MQEYQAYSGAKKECFSPLLYKVEMTAENIELLKAQYHEVRGHPAFIREFLAGNPSSNAIRMLFNNPKFISWTKDGSAVFIPNYPHIERGALESDPKRYKLRDGGLALNAWFVHPKQLEESIFANPKIRENPQLIQQSYSYAPSLEKNNHVYRVADQKRIRELEDASGVRYLTSVFDFTKDDLPYLKNLKATAMETLQREYGVDASDKVDMFFHGVIGLGTTTSHLHVRVNQKILPIEQQNSVYLDEIIDRLEKGGSIKEMMMERKQIYHTLAEGNAPKVHEGVVRVPNHYSLPHLLDSSLALLKTPLNFVDRVCGYNFVSSRGFN